MGSYNKSNQKQLFTEQFSYKKYTQPMHKYERCELLFVFLEKWLAFLYRHSLKVFFIEVNPLIFHKTHTNREHSYK